MTDSLPIIWDFDGTLLPILPHDSEQTLMLCACRIGSDRCRAVKRILARLLTEADRREWFCTDPRRRIYLRLYPWLLYGVSVDLLHRVANELAAKITPADREALLQLKRCGHPMAVVSCGTADLSERVLRMAGVDDCFDWIAGNRLRIDSGVIAGMDIRLLNAQSKVRCILEKGIEPGGFAAVGDGYTDLPLLDRADIAVMMDPTGKKQRSFGGRGYHFSRSVAQAAEIIMRQCGLSREMIEA